MSNIKDYLEHFYQFILVEKKFSSHTCIAYKNDLNDCLEYLTRQYNFNQDVATVSYEMIRSWMAYLKIKK